MLLLNWTKSLGTSIPPPRYSWFMVTKTLYHRLCLIYSYIIGAAELGPSCAYIDFIFLGDLAAAFCHEPICLIRSSPS